MQGLLRIAGDALRKLPSRIVRGPEVEMILLDPEPQPVISSGGENAL